MGGRLEGEVALITGASRGFGERIAKAFAQEGAAVALFARSSGDIETHVRAIEADGGRAIAIKGDVTEQADVERAVKETKDRLGAATILVNNAGIPGPFGPIGHVDPEEWWRALTIHIKAPMMFMGAVLPDMRSAGRGRIINVASIGGTMIRKAMSAYGVGKCAEIRLTEHVAAETQGEGINAFSIQPGLVATGMTDATVGDPNAQKWAPHMIATIKERAKTHADPEAGLQRCAEMCIDLASGDFDILSGRFLLPEDDFAALKRDAEAHAG